MSLNEIKRLAHELRLFGFHESMERRLKSFHSEGQTGEEFLRMMLEDERQYRKNIVSKRLESQAKF